MFLVVMIVIFPLDLIGHMTTSEN
uniref:Uncharacterized protein n=1 Tax=Anguilla anguilla TaxID=7936 RepID=A0A0E9S741_ANGAN